jgi:hypothetical protein
MDFSEIPFQKAHYHPFKTHHGQQGPQGMEEPRTTYRFKTVAHSMQYKQIGLCASTTEGLVEIPGMIDLHNRICFSMDNQERRRIGPYLLQGTGGTPLFLAEYRKAIGIGPLVPEGPGQVRRPGQDDCSLDRAALIQMVTHIPTRFRACKGSKGGKMATRTVAKYGDAPGIKIVGSRMGPQVTDGQLDILYHDRETEGGKQAVIDGSHQVLSPGLGQVETLLVSFGPAPAVNHHNQGPRAGIPGPWKEEIQFQPGAGNLAVHDIALDGTP